MRTKDFVPPWPTRRPKPYPASSHNSYRLLFALSRAIRLSVSLVMFCYPRGQQGSIFAETGRNSQKRHDTKEKEIARFATLTAGSDSVAPCFRGSVLPSLIWKGSQVQ